MHMHMFIDVAKHALFPVICTYSYWLNMIMYWSIRTVVVSVCMCVHYLFLYIGLVFSSLLVMVLHAHQFLLAYKLGMMARTLMTAVIYQKVFNHTCSHSSKCACVVFKSYVWYMCLFFRYR